MHFEYSRLGLIDGLADIFVFGFPKLAVRRGIQRQLFQVAAGDKFLE
jgi:hypothetical protein